MNPEALTGRMLQARGRYRRWLDARFGKGMPAGVLVGEPVPLGEVLVPAVLTPAPVSEYAPEDALHREGRALPAWLGAPDRGHAYLVEGPAGSGKTTLLHQLVRSLAGAVGDALNQRLPHHVVFPLVLRELEPAPEEPLESLVDRWLARARREDPELSPAAVRAFAEQGLAVFCLDGLDEVLDGAGRAALLRAWGASPWACRGGNHLLVTTRPAAFDDASSDIPTDFQKLYLAPFDHDQVGRYLSRWFAAQPLSPEARERHLGELWRALTEGPRARSLRALARRPAYLASLAVVHLTRGALPSSRALLLDALVDASVDALDRHRAVPPGSPEAARWERWEKRDALAGVAWLCHTHALDDTQGEGRAVTFSREGFTRAVTRVLHAGQRRYTSLRPEHAEGFARWALSRTGILAATTQDRWQFGHLAFQEFLTAVYVLDRASAGADKPRVLARMLFSRLGDPAWHDVALLALSLDASRTAGQGPHAALATLSPEDNGHRAFLGWTLAGEELSLGDGARDAWVRGWALACAQDGVTHYAREVAGHPGNHRALDALWGAVTGLVLTGADPRAVPREDLARSPRPERTSEDPIEVLEALVATDPLEAPRRWGAWASDAPREVFTATVLGLPAAGDHEPPEARARLLALAQERALLQRDDGRIPAPSRVWGALNAWVATWRSLVTPLARATPLPWVRAAQEEPLPAVGAVCFAPAADPLLRWRQRAWRWLLALEARWSVCVALASVELLAPEGDQAPRARRWLEASLQLVNARTAEHRARVQPVLLGLREGRLAERLGEGYDAALEDAPAGAVERALGVANAQALLSEAAALWGGGPTPRGSPEAWWRALHLARQRRPDPARDGVLDAAEARAEGAQGPAARVLAAAVFHLAACDQVPGDAAPDVSQAGLGALRDLLVGGAVARGLLPDGGVPSDAEVTQEWGWLQRSAFAPERVVDRLLAWESAPWEGTFPGLLDALARCLGP